MANETTTITEMVEAQPDVDNTAVHERLWEVLTGFRDKLAERFELTPHPSTADHAAWESGSFEGSLNTYTAAARGNSPEDRASDGVRPSLDWFVHSWIGNRKNSILDMNINVWLGPEIDVPHFTCVFGTVPNLYHYSDFIARRDLMTDVPYLETYYEPENAHLLDFRSRDRWTWSVSHGTYMRAILSPVGYSFMGDRSPECLDEYIGFAQERFDRWLALVDAAPPVPEEERPALAARDRFLREAIYTLDPMNALAEKFMGAEMVDTMVKLRYGHTQLHGDDA